MEIGFFTVFTVLFIIQTFLYFTSFYSIAEDWMDECLLNRCIISSNAETPFGGFTT